MPLSQPLLPLEALLRRGCPRPLVALPFLPSSQASPPSQLADTAEGPFLPVPPSTGRGGSAPSPHVPGGGIRRPLWAGFCSHCEPPRKDWSPKLLSPRLSQMGVCGFLASAVCCTRQGGSQLGWNGRESQVLGIVPGPSGHPTGVTQSAESKVRQTWVGSCSTPH